MNRMERAFIGATLIHLNRGIAALDPSPTRGTSAWQAREDLDQARWLLDGVYAGLLEHATLDDPDPPARLRILRPDDRPPS